MLQLERIYFDHFLEYLIQNRVLRLQHERLRQGHQLINLDCILALQLVFGHTNVGHQQVLAVHNLVQQLWLLFQSLNYLGSLCSFQH